MDISPLFLARAQFLSSLSFLAFFLAVALALAWVLLFFKLCARYAKQPAWIAAYRFWVRIFALSFVLALAAAVPLLIQFGSLWGNLMDKIGNVTGPLIGYGVLSVFILKSYFFGRHAIWPAQGGRRRPHRGGVHVGVRSAYCRVLDRGVAVVDANARRRGDRGWSLPSLRLVGRNFQCFGGLAYRANRRGCGSLCRIFDAVGNGLVGLAPPFGRR
jgi:Cytochrome bd terminal oxidase subunit I